MDRIDTTVPSRTFKGGAESLQDTFEKLAYNLCGYNNRGDKDCVGEIDCNDCAFSTKENLMSFLLDTLEDGE